MVFCSSVVVPLPAGVVGHLVEPESLLFPVEVLAGVGRAHERYAYLHLYLLARLGVVGEE